MHDAGTATPGESPVTRSRTGAGCSGGVDRRRTVKTLTTKRSPQSLAGGTAPLIHCAPYKAAQRVAGGRQRAGRAPTSTAGGGGGDAARAGRVDGARRRPHTAKNGPSASRAGPAFAVAPIGCH